MESRIMQVFYGNDCLPYKDSARSVHYPIVGNSFIGASNTTQIRFYVRDIGGVNNVSWVAISKLPNGKIGSQVLSSIHLDSELNEYYVALDLSSYYTQLKGDVYISLNGYQGGVQVEEDEDTGIYTIVGTPIIEATGSIKLAINYAPQLPLGQHFNISDIQQMLGLISEKANIVNTVQVVADISQEDLSGYDGGQLFYDLESKQYYEKIGEEPYYQLVEDSAGILGSERVLVRYLVDSNLRTIQDLYDLVGTRTAIVRVEELYGSFEGLVRFRYQYPTGPVSVRVVYLDTLTTQYANLVDTSASNYATMDTLLGSFLTASKYNDRILHQNNYKDYAVPYSGATDNVDLGEHYIKGEVANNDNTKKGGFQLIADSSGASRFEGYLKLESHINSTNKKSSIRYRAQDVYFIPDTTQGQYNYTIQFPEENGTFATREWTNSAISTLKANAFILVDTTTYPTLASFLESEGEEGYIYLYPVDESNLDNGDPQKGYYQYIWESNEWLSIGTTQIDLSDYYTKTQADDRFVRYSGGTKDVNLGNHSLTANHLYIRPQASTGYKDLTFYKGGSYTTDGRIRVAANGNSMTFYASGYSYQVQTGSSTYDEIATQGYVTNAVNTMGATKVDKTSSAEKVYGTDELGAQMTYSVDSDLVGSGAIVRRETSTGTVVVGTPTSNTHATTKGYVDNAISNAISNVYKIKGSATVSQINAMTNQQVGDVYNLTDSGTINSGSLQVFTGDNIVWTGSAWDKLGAEIDWSAYDEKFIAAGFFEVQPYNENTGEITFVYSTELYIMSYDSDTGIMTIQAN